MKKIFLECVGSVFAAKRAKENGVERRPKDIEYICVFAPRENGTGFYAVCAG